MLILVVGGSVLWPRGVWRENGVLFFFNSCFMYNNSFEKYLHFDLKDLAQIKKKMEAAWLLFQIFWSKFSVVLLVWQYQTRGLKNLDLLVQSGVSAWSWEELKPLIGVSLPVWAGWWDVLWTKLCSCHLKITKCLGTLGKERGYKWPTRTICFNLCRHVDGNISILNSFRLLRFQELSPILWHLVSFSFFNGFRA